MKKKIRRKKLIITNKLTYEIFIHMRSTSTKNYFYITKRENQPSNQHIIINTDKISQKNQHFQVAQIKNNNEW